MGFLAKALQSATESISQVIDVDEDRTLLEAILSAGLSVNYSCRTGRCESCKFALVKGIAYDCATGERLDIGDHLACTTKLGSDIEFSMDVAPAIAVTVISSRAKIASINRLGEGVVDIWLSLPGRISFDYIPGQFLDVSAASVTRSYSIAGYDSKSHSIRLFIKKKNGGAMSKYWFNEASEGDLISIKGPFGGWTIPLSLDRKIFVAGGSGIAPFLGYLSKVETVSDVGILWGVRWPEEVICVKDPSLSRASSIDVICSNGRFDDRDAGYVQDLPGFVSLVNSSVDIYVCGGEVFVQAVVAKLIEIGVCSSRISKELFV